MKKYLLILSLLATSAFAVGRLQRYAEGPDQQFRCYLSEIQCDACRTQITEEFNRESGIRQVAFEGADRKELLITHAPFRTEQSLKDSLARLGYRLDAPATADKKPASADNCACPGTRRTNNPFWR
jgi:hypothetical protein